MNPIIQLTGKVTYPITLDPTLWIFDDRRFEMADRFPGVNGLGMELAPFLDHAKPLPEAAKMVIYQREGSQTVLPLEDARTAVLQFAQEGKPIHPGGPALLHLPDGKLDQPIGSIEKMELV
ncbi:MAG: hypothetical protein M0Z65_09010 [Firmicutes bacterium]|uniref:Uncharacterized protein n=1 Tax=Melghirimyces thermohalophilus TaxID=1236220 RepID=A0A1G6R195_9BACL|nr:hypothetical protein [Melghirimyces thermohalophilus]MDA8353303.1 hypothetical protein [Bacillota bacterium]SDC97686.1 hypothetical protein SAMN04488112_12510 [Melghirimyces thermohalophilus]